MIVVEVDAETGEQTERPMTEPERAQLAADQATTAALEQAAADRATRRSAILERLGLSDAEADVLLGIG